MEKYYQVNGIKMYAIEEGPQDGEVILFLHGFPEFWYSWKSQLAFFSDMGFKAIAPDQRGYNLSDKPDSVKDYHILTLVKDIADLIKSTGKEKVYLVGHDWGALVGWKLVENHPDLIHKFISLNTPHPRIFKRTIRTDIRQFFISSYIYFAQIPSLPEMVLKMADYKILLETMNFTSKKTAFSESDLMEYKKSWKAGNMRAMINWYRAGKYSREPEEDIKIKVPVLFIWGKQERFFVEAVVQKSLELCDNGNLYETKGTHWLHREKPEEVNQKILEFINNG